MFSSARGGYWTEILLGIVQHERRASFYSPRGYRYALRLSKANKNQVLAIIREIKIFVLNEPLAAQAHRLEEAAEGVSKTCWQVLGHEALGQASWVNLKLQF